jgi:hypothetical protein
LNKYGNTDATKKISGTGLSIASLLMMLFGLAEIVTSFRHEFFGLTTSQAVVSTIIGAIIGLLYFVSGLLVLTKRRMAAIAAIIFARR